MIIWRGFGALAVLFIGAGAGIGAAIGSSLGDRWVMPMVGVGLILGGVGTALFGQWLNVTRPAGRVRVWSAERSAQLHDIADAGTFHLGPGYAAPQSMEEAHHQADLLVAAEEQEARARSRNQHTLFFIPIQWVGWGAAISGVMVLISGLIAG